MAKKDIICDKVILKKDFSVKTDGQRFKQVLNCLFYNAVKYTSAGMIQIKVL